MNYEENWATVERLPFPQQINCISCAFSGWCHAIHFLFSNGPNMATIIAQELVPTWLKLCVMIG